MIHTVETAARLLELPAATLHAGDVAQVLGRLVPGDGSWLYRWDPNSTAGPNGGTVLAPGRHARRGPLAFVPQRNGGMRAASAYSARTSRQTTRWTR